MTIENFGTLSSQKTVLLVDDHKNSLIVLKKMLERSGINVIAVDNGQDALNVFRENQKVDLVLMDIKMPVMDGYNAMKEIKKLNPKMKVIAETAYGLYGDKKTILDAGFDGYLPKPITKESLDDMLKVYLS
jgi:two-component system, cell cycle response regulator DivK